ncbi:MAG: hypothetical protein AAFX54_00325 [Pseudomonadota bacterium]
MNFFKRFHLFFFSANRRVAHLIKRVFISCLSIALFTSKSLQLSFKPRSPIFPQTVAAGIVVGATLYKFLYIFSGALLLTRSDGASRLFFAVERYGDPNYLANLKTWGELPLPAPQLFYSALFALDQASDGFFDITKTVLVTSVIAYAISCWLFSIIAFRTLGSIAGVLTAILLTAAKMPTFFSTTAAVEPMAILFFSFAFFYAVRALQSEANPAKSAILLSALCICLASAFRIEFAVFALFFGAFLFHRIGTIWTTAYVLLAFAFVGFQLGLTNFHPALSTYWDISKHYTSINKLPLTSLPDTALFRSGFFNAWGAIPAYGIVVIAIVALGFRKARFFSLIALSSFALIVFAVTAGKIAAGQPRYLMLQMMLFALPVSGAAQYLYDYSKQSNTKWVSITRVSIAFCSGALLIALSFANFRSAIQDRVNAPTLAVRNTMDFLSTRLQPNDIIFLDYLKSYESSIALHTYAEVRTKGHTYLSRCCIPLMPGEAVSREELTRLTSDRSAVVQSLSGKDKFKALQIWSDGFIDTNRPTYFISMRGKWLQERRKATESISTTAYSFIHPFMNEASADGDNIRRYRLSLPYSNLRLCLKEVYKNRRIVVYQAFYPSETSRLVTSTEYC